MPQEERTGYRTTGEFQTIEHEHLPEFRGVPLDVTGEKTAELRQVRSMMLVFEQSIQQDREKLNSVRRGLNLDLLKEDPPSLKGQQDTFKALQLRQEQLLNELSQANKESLDEQGEIDYIVTGKGSTYKYLPDGRTQRFKKVEGKEYEPMDALVFVPNYEWVKANAPQNILKLLGETELDYEQILLSYVQGKGKKNYIVDEKGNKLKNNQEISEAKKVFLTFGDESGTDFAIPVSPTPKKGYQTFDTRKYVKDGEGFRENHLGNKVVEIYRKKTDKNIVDSEVENDVKAEQKALENAQYISRMLGRGSLAVPGLYMHALREQRLHELGLSELALFIPLGTNSSQVTEIQSFFEREQNRIKSLDSLNQEKEWSRLSRKIGDMRKAVDIKTPELQKRYENIGTGNKEKALITAQEVSHLMSELKLSTERASDREFALVEIPELRSYSSQVIERIKTGQERKTEAQLFYEDMIKSMEQNYKDTKDKERAYFDLKLEFEELQKIIKKKTAVSKK